jgi:hypothetical protein
VKCFICFFSSSTTKVLLRSTQVSICALDLFLLNSLSLPSASDFLSLLGQESRDSMRAP